MRSLSATGQPPVLQEPSGAPGEDSLAQWGGRRLGFPTPYSNHLSRETILDGLLSHQPAFAARVPDAGDAPGTVGRLLAVLWVRDGLADATRFGVRGPHASIGRDPGNDLVLESQSVSARHAELSLAGGVWTLTDLGSINGTWVDGVRVVDSLDLSPGSEVRIAGVVLSFSPRDEWSDSPRPSASTAASPAPSGLLFLDTDDPAQAPRLLVRAAVVMLVCLVAYLLLAVR